MTNNSLFNPMHFFEFGQTLAVLKYGSTLRSLNACKHRMHDFIVVVNQGVENSLNWHSDLLKKNPNHYSKISRFFGSYFIVMLQKYSKYYPIYYNSCIPTVNNKIFKYGVISKEDLLNSLENWSSLFVSQRLQKTICFIGNDAKLDSEINEKLVENRKKALILSLLSLSNDGNRRSFNELNNSENSEKTITLFDLLRKIVTLTYKGDIRFISDIGKKRFFQVCEKELMDSLPFLVSYYLPLILEYIKENGKIISLHNKNDYSKIKDVLSLSKSLYSKLESLINGDPFSGMSSEIASSNDWDLFYKLFVDDKIRLSVSLLIINNKIDFIILCCCEIRLHLQVQSEFGVENGRVSEIASRT